MCVSCNHEPKNDRVLLQKNTLLTGNIHLRKSIVCPQLNLDFWFIREVFSYILAISFHSFCFVTLFRFKRAIYGPPKIWMNSCSVRFYEGREEEIIHNSVICKYKSHSTNLQIISQFKTANTVQISMSCHVFYNFDKMNQGQSTFHLLCDTHMYAQFIIKKNGFLYLS